MIRIHSIKSSVQQSLSRKTREFHLLSPKVPPSHCRRWLSTAPIESSQYGDDTEENPHFPNLFKSLDLGPAIGALPNRVIMGSMHSGLEGHSVPSFLIPLLQPEHDHDDLSAMATYFKERAKGGAGLMVTGGIAPNRAGWVAPFSSKLSTRDEMELHKVVTEEVHSISVPTYHSEHGEGGGAAAGSERARICLQILHAGRYAMHPFAVSASSTKAPIAPFRARELSLSGVKSTIRDYVHCAVLAKEAGYDGIEIMGSEGYLINQFLVKRTNKRNDEYGGEDFQNRMKFAVDIVRETREAVGEDFIIIFRLSMLDLVKDGSDWNEIKIMAQAIEDAGATIMNTGIGWHEARVPTIATSVPRKSFAWVTKKMRDENILSIPLCATNRVNAPHVGESIIGGEYADLVSMARPFLADPYIMSKSREGRVDEINTCIGCNQACLDHVFVGKVASCLVNPLACHETELKVEKDSIPADERLNISVIGSGPAGLAFATTAATIGHNVTLYDKSEMIGGQFNMAKRIPGKEEFYETIRYFDWQLKNLEKEGRLTLKLGTEITNDDMLNESTVDKWIVATGVDPRTPSIPGIDHPNVFSYIDVLRHRKTPGKRVAIIGAGGIGFDVTEYLIHGDNVTKHERKADEVDIDEYLSEWGVDRTNESRGGLLSSSSSQHSKLSGREVIMLQRKKGKLGKGLGKTTGWIHRATLAKSGSVEMVDAVTYNKIDSEGNLHITVNKGTPEESKRVLEVDNIVTCAGQISKKDLEKDASDDDELAAKVYTIGGAYEAGELDAKRAIDMSTRLALKINDPSIIPGKHAFKAGVGVEERLITMLRRFS